MEKSREMLRIIGVTRRLVTSLSSPSQGDRFRGMHRAIASKAFKQKTVVLFDTSQAS